MDVLLPLLMPLLVPLLVPLLPVESLVSGLVLLLVDPLPLLIPLPVVLLLSVVPALPLELPLSVVPLLDPLLPLDEPLLLVLSIVLPVVPLLLVPLLPAPLLSVALLLPLESSRVVLRVGSLDPPLLLCVSLTVSFPNAGTMLAIADTAAAAEINCLTFMLTSKKKLITPALMTRQEMPGSASFDVHHLLPMICGSPRFYEKN